MNLDIDKFDAINIGDGVYATRDIKAGEEIQVLMLYSRGFIDSNPELKGFMAKFPDSNWDSIWDPGV